MNLYNTQRKDGFTIIETLVAITVLMIAIAGPLVVATKGLTSALVSKDQMIASYLAQESMEVIKNKRDNNMQSNVDWLDMIGQNGCNKSNGGGNKCDASALDSSDYSHNCNVKGCQLYFDSSSGYNHQGIGNPTIFYRYYYLENLVTNAGKEQITVHVVVDWNEGTVPYQIDLTSQLVKVVR